MPDTPAARAVIYEMPATATAPRSHSNLLTPDEVEAMMCVRAVRDNR